MGKLHQVFDTSSNRIALSQRALDRPPVKRQLKDDTTFESADASFFVIEIIRKIAIFCGMTKEKNYQSFSEEPNRPAVRRDLDRPNS